MILTFAAGSLEPAVAKSLFSVRRYTVYLLPREGIVVNYHFSASHLIFTTLPPNSTKIHLTRLHRPTARKEHP